MTTVIVCQTCDEIIDITEGEKVEVLYGKCPKCTPAVDETPSASI